MAVGLQPLISGRCGLPGAGGVLLTRPSPSASLSSPSQDGSSLLAPWLCAAGFPSAAAWAKARRGITPACGRVSRSYVVLRRVGRVERALLFVCLSLTSVSLLQSRHVAQGKQGALCVGWVWGTAQRAVLGAGPGAACGSLLLHLYGMGRNGPILQHGSGQCSYSVKLKGKEMTGKEKEGKTSAVKEEGVDSNWE